MNRNSLTKIKKDNAFNEKQINKKIFYKSSQNPQYAQKIPSGYSISQKIGDPQSTVKYWKFQWPLFNFIPRDPYPQFPLIYDEKNAWFLLFFVKIFMIIFLFFSSKYNEWPPNWTLNFIFGPNFSPIFILVLTRSIRIEETWISRI